MVNENTKTSDFFGVNEGESNEFHELLFGNNR